MLISVLVLIRLVSLDPKMGPELKVRWLLLYSGLNLTAIKTKPTVEQLCMELRRCACVSYDHESAQKLF